MIAFANLTLTWDDVFARLEMFYRLVLPPVLTTAKAAGRKHALVYGVPRGGAIVAGWMAARSRGQVEMTPDPNLADLFVDDVLDSGETAEWHRNRWPRTPLWVLVDKQAEEARRWVVFPWEGEAVCDDPAARGVTRLLQAIGEDPSREGLLDTPSRVVRAYREMTQGYQQDPAKILEKQFATEHSDLVIVRDVWFTSLCEHHLLPFAGFAHLGYIPGEGRVVGLSKLARLVDCFSQRLQLQEQLTHQLADAVHEHCGAAGTGVVVEASHACMGCRGAKRHESTTATSAVRGVLRDDAAARAEFMSLLRGRR